VCIVWPKSIGCGGTVAYKTDIIFPPNACVYNAMSRPFFSFNDNRRRKIDVFTVKNLLKTLSRLLIRVDFDLIILMDNVTYSLYTFILKWIVRGMQKAKINVRSWRIKYLIDMWGGLRRSWRSIRKNWKGYVKKIRDTPSHRGPNSSTASKYIKRFENLHTHYSRCIITSWFILFFTRSEQFNLFFFKYIIIFYYYYGYRGK